MVAACRIKIVDEEAAGPVALAGEQQQRDVVLRRQREAVLCCPGLLLQVLAVTWLPFADLQAQNKLPIPAGRLAGNY